MVVIERLLTEKHGTSIHYTPSDEERRIPYVTRRDPMSGNISKISEERAKRPLAISVSCDITPVEKCDFCDYRNSTTKPIIEHQCGAVSFPNKFSWEKYDWNTAYPPFGKHKLLLSEVYFEDLERMIESSYDLAGRCGEDEDVIGFMDFTNWGPYAGASQQHPHSQRKSMTHELSSVQEMELRFCKELAERHENPFTTLLREEREDGRRIIYDSDVVILAQFAPTCPDEVLVFPNEEFSHVLQMGYNDRMRIIRPTLGIFPALFFYRGITDLNIAIHMAPFKSMEEARKYYRWHMHILPRRSRLPVAQAGAEMGFGIYVIDTFPEITAEVLRRWYREGPRPELLVKSPDGNVDPALLNEFNRINGKN